MSKYPHLDNLFGEQDAPRPLDYYLWTCTDHGDEEYFADLKKRAEAVATNLHCIVGKSFWDKEREGSVGVLIIGQLKAPATA